MNTESEQKKKKSTRLQKQESAAQDIRDFPLIFIKGGENDGYIGEIEKLKSGEWESRRFGKNYPNDSAKYPDEQKAVTFFQQIKK